MDKYEIDYSDYASRCKSCNELLKQTEMIFGMCGACRGLSYKEFSYATDHEFHHMGITESTAPQDCEESCSGVDE